MNHTLAMKRTSGGESESDLSTDENIKRKRELSREIEIFKRSKRVTRTPNKEREKENKNNEMDDLKEMMSGIMSELKAFRKENHENIKELKEQNELLKQQNEDLKQEINHLKERVTQLEEIKQRVQRIEKDKIKNNIVISGLTVKDKSKEEIKRITENLLTDHVEVEAKIKNAYRINDHMCVIEIENFETKIEILKKKSKVRYLKQNRIFINSELTNKEREIQKIIRDRARLERQNGNITKVGYQSLIVNGQEWKWNQHENKLDLKATSNTGVSTSKN